jgi:hypothetical protein
MSVTVIHQPRVAWDAARMMISSCMTGHFGWMCDHIGDLFGSEFANALWQTLMHLQHSERDNIRQIELGLWRVRFEDAMLRMPALAAPLQALVVEAKVRTSAA